jgi:peroxiredoxin
MDIIRIVAPFNDETLEWRKIVKYSKNNLVRIAAIFHLAKYNFQFNNYEKCTALLDTLNIKYSVSEKDTKHGKEISYMKETICRLSIGNILPNFQATDINGNVIDLEKLKGKVVLLYFHGPGCGSCIKMYPTLNKLYNNYRNKDFFILGISCDEGPQKQFPSYLKKFGIHWTQTIDFQLFNKYNILALSTSFLINKQGNLVFIGHADEVISSINYLQGKSLEDAVEFLIKS